MNESHFIDHLHDACKLKYCIWLFQEMATWSFWLDGIPTKQRETSLFVKQCAIQLWSAKAQTIICAVTFADICPQFNGSFIMVISPPTFQLLTTGCCSWKDITGKSHQHYKTISLCRLVMSQPIINEGTFNGIVMSAHKVITGDTGHTTHGSRVRHHYAHTIHGKPAGDMLILHAMYIHSPIIPSL